MKALPNGAFLNISPQWPSAINVTNSQQATTYLPATSAFEDVPETARLTGVFVIIDNSKGEGTNTSAVDLNFCIREYNTVVTNGHYIFSVLNPHRENLFFRPHANESTYQHPNRRR
jgi:hypothetical protein